MGPQLSSAVKDFASETEFQSLWEVLVDTFANTLVKELFDKEFIPKFEIFCLIYFPDYTSSFEPRVKEAIKSPSSQPKYLFLSTKSYADLFNKDLVLFSQL